MIQLNDDDLREKCVGHSGIAVTHIPTGCVASAGLSASRATNRSTAMMRLVAQVVKHQRNEPCDERVKRKLSHFAAEAGMRSDWHGPGVTATVEGDHLDNAMGDSGIAGEYQ